MPKIRLLVDETIARIYENGKNVGPARCTKGQVVEVDDALAGLMIDYGRAELVGVKKTKPEKADDGNKSRKRVPKKQLSKWLGDAGIG